MVSPSSQYLHNWHIDLIASKLEQCRRGEIKRLIINIPPRYMKSICASVAFPAWLLGHDPSCQIICASYGQELASKHARDTRSVMESIWYRSLFSARLHPRKASVEEFVTTQSGMRMATSVGGVLTGRGADFLIIDDPLKPDEAISQSQRNAVNQWYDGTLYSRLNDKAQGCIILIMQRLHEEDLVGHVLAQEGWETVVLPAIAEVPEEYVYQSIFGTHRKYCVVGELLHKEREPQAVIEHMRATIGEYHFAGQYQQSPAPLGGGMIKTDWFARYKEAPIDIEHIYQSWDTANKATEMSDYSVCSTWGVKHKQYYLLNVYRERLEFPALKRAVIAQAERWKAKTVLIEDRASGTQLIQDLRHEYQMPVIAILPEQDKASRMMAQTAVIESGLVFIPESAPWLTAFLHELSCFPNGKRDDQVDSVSQFLNWHRRHSACVPRISRL